MRTPIFITGTDTDVGKTFVTTRLLDWCRQQGIPAVGVKPLASGAVEQAGVMRSSDACALIEASSEKRPYEWHNPYVFAPAIAPHIAAADINLSLSVNQLAQQLGQYAPLAHEVMLIEGAGGWLLPLNSSETFAQVVQQLQWPVILVVGMRLGCLNHALLTMASIREQQVSCLGWIANAVDPHMQRFDENLSTLRDHLGEPLAIFLHGAMQPNSGHRLSVLL